MFLSRINECAILPTAPKHRAGGEIEDERRRVSNLPRVAGTLFQWYSKLGEHLVAIIGLLKTMNSVGLMTYAKRLKAGHHYRY